MTNERAEEMTRRFKRIVERVSGTWADAKKEALEHFKKCTAELELVPEQMGYVEELAELFVGADDSTSNRIDFELRSFFIDVASFRETYFDQYIAGEAAFNAEVIAYCKIVKGV